MKSLFYRVVVLAVMACPLLTVSCKDGGPESNPSLEVSGKALEFEAVGAASQSVEVKAVDVEWDILMEEQDKSWISAVRDGDAKILVSVGNNASKEVRTGKITVYAPDNVKVAPQVVTVTQKALGEGVEYSLGVEPNVLKFAASDDKAQEAVVTVKGEGLTWSTKTEGLADWATVKTEGDKIIVTVEDNTETEVRVTSVDVVPGIEGVEAKVLRIEQEAYVLPPSLGVTFEEDPKFPANAKNTAKTIYVEAVSLEWDVRVEDENGGQQSWLHATPMTEGYSIVDVRADNNTELSPRSAYVVVFAKGGEAEPVKILFTQEAAKEHLSTLDGDRDLNVMVNSLVVVSANDKDEPQEEAVSGWDIRLWSDGILYENSVGRYTGTGERIHIMLFAGYVPESEDGDYRIPAGEYTANASGIYNGIPDTFMIGKDSNNMTFPMGSWYVEMNDNKAGLAGPITVGTITVSYDGDDHVLKMELEDDLGNSLTGTYKGKLDFR